MPETAQKQASIAISIPDNLGPHWSKNAKQSYFLFGFPAFLWLMVAIPQGGLNLTMAQIGGLLVVCWIIFCHKYSSYSERRYQKTKQEQLSAAQKNILSTYTPFTQTHGYTTANALAFISVDESRMQVLVGGCDAAYKSYSARLINVADIISVEVIEDARPAMMTEAGNSLVGAAAGGLIFGGAGAVVGAIALKNARTLSRVSLVFTLDDVAAPLVEVNFLEIPTTKDLPAHHDALQQAKHWHGAINVLLHRYRKTSANQLSQA